jgi:hypothetical protein
LAVFRLSIRSRRNTVVRELDRTAKLWGTVAVTAAMLAILVVVFDGGW